MSDYDSVSSFDLLVSYVDHSIPEEGAGELLTRLHRDDELLVLLQKNIIADIWLRELFRAPRDERAMFTVPEIDEGDMVSPASERISFDNFLFQEPGDLGDSLVPCDDCCGEIIHLGLADEPSTWKKYFFGTGKTVPQVKSEKVKQTESASNAPLRKKSDLFFWIRLCLFFMAIAWLANDGWHSSRTRKEDFNALATVTETVDAVWEPGTQSLKRGQQLVAGELALRSGVVRLVYGNGTSVVMEAPTRISLQGDKTAFCSHGKISVHVSKESTNFEINTMFAKFIDRGTAFSLEVNPDGVRTDVIEGQIDVGYLRKSRSASDQSEPIPLLNLVMGEAFAINKKLEVKKEQAETARYIDSKRFGKLVSEYVSRCKLEHAEKRKKIDSRPDLLMRFELTGPSILSKNKAPRGRLFCQNMSFFECRETEGFHPGSRSVAFGSRRAKGMFTLPGQYESMTLIVSVRLDRLPNAGNVFLASDEYIDSPGAPLWQISQSGRLIANVTGKDKNSFVTVMSEPCFGREEYGTWCRFAVVLDGKNGHISHYKDGRFVSSGTWKDPVPITWNTTAVGNHILRDSAASGRYIDGAIDELILFDRALSAEEIALLDF